jgi:hypothetical protein
MSRESLTPIVLPADPANAMEAATKQYVDHLITVATTAPSSPAVNQLWVDST